MPDNTSNIAQLLARLSNKTATIGIIGMGYVGLPLALRFSEAGFRVIGLDIDPEKVVKLNRGESYVKHIPAASSLSDLAHSSDHVTLTDRFTRQAHPSSGY